MKSVIWFGLIFLIQSVCSAQLNVLDGSVTGINSLISKTNLYVGIGSLAPTRRVQFDVSGLPKMTMWSNGAVGFGNVGADTTDTAHFVIKQSLSSVTSSERYQFLNDMVLTPSLPIAFDVAAVRDSISISGTNQVRDASGVYASLTISNTNANNRGHSVLAHVATSETGQADQLSGVRTSLDHNSSGTISSLMGIWVNQVDIGAGNGTISDLYGVRVDTISGANKTRSYGVYVGDPAATNFFNGPVGIKRSTPIEALEVVGNATFTGIVSPTNGVASGSSNLLVVTTVVLSGTPALWTNTLTKNVQTTWSGGTVTGVGVNASLWPTLATGGYVILQPGEWLAFTNAGVPAFAWKPL